SASPPFITCSKGYGPKEDLTANASGSKDAEKLVEKRINKQTLNSAKAIWSSFDSVSTSFRG
ncbi:MAG: hypothetical protein ACYC3I_17285, partial [Gemmataceae bacterium]